NSGKECGEPVVVVAAPALERMVVALGALQADAQEYLAGSLGPIERRGGDAVEVDRAVGEGAAAREDQVSDEFIRRPVLPKLIENPLGENERALWGQRGAVDAQQVSPLQRPEIGI